MQDEYRFPNDNSRCPVCGSHDIEGDSLEVVGGCVFQDCSCSVCGAEWTDEYDFTKRFPYYRG